MNFIDKIVNKELGKVKAITFSKAVYWSCAKIYIKIGTPSHKIICTTEFKKTQTFYVFHIHIKYFTLNKFIKFTFNKQEKSFGIFD